MKAYLASSINGIILIFFGAWGYFGSDSNSVTALIPVLAGIILLVLNRGLRKENKMISHIVVIFTFLLLLALIKPLTGAIGRNDSWAIFRVAVMMLATCFALLLFLKNFRDNRKIKA